MTIRIMPVGDSITVGSDAEHPTDFNSYRKELWSLMTAAGWDVDFVGSQSNGTGSGWDKDHEGHGGYTCGQIEAGAAGWIAAANPDVILLLIGVNDILTPLTIPGKWATLLTALKAADPLVRIFMSPMTPAFPTPANVIPTLTADVATANAALPGVIETAQDAGVLVELAHVGDAVFVADDAISTDGVHPSESGYTRMAQLWYEALEPYFAALTVPTVPDDRVSVEAMISWDGSGDFDGDDDDVTGALVVTTGVTARHGRADSLTLSPPRVSDGGIELHNDDGTYSQERADSPVYQRVLPGRPVRYRVGHGQRRRYRSHVAYRDRVYYRGQGMWPLGRHVIREISQSTEIGNRRVRLDTIGYEAVLTRAAVTVAVQSNIRTDQAVTLLLDAAGWPSDKRDVSIGDTTLLYWWCDEKTPWDALLELLGAEGPGTYYVSRDGVFHWENRNYRTVAARSTTTQARYFDRDDSARTLYREHVGYRGNRLYRGRTGGLWFTSFQYDPGFKNIANRATYATKRRTLGALGVAWSYGTSFDLTALQTRTLIARPTSPFQDAVSPVLTTDYTVVGGTVSVSLSATSGLVAFITVTATSGTPTVSGLQLRAKPLTVVSETMVQNSVDASASIAKFSPIPGADIPIPLSISGWPEIDPSQAEAVCNAWVNRYMEPRPLVTLGLRNANAAHIRQMLERMPSDRLTLSETNTGLTADVWINSTELRISEAHGRVVSATLGCELCDTLTGAVWEVSEWDDPAAVWGV